jgi:tryptophan 2,3-dioxygenase
VGGESMMDKKDFDKLSQLMTELQNEANKRLHDDMMNGIKHYVREEIHELMMGELRHAVAETVRAHVNIEVKVSNAS